MRRLAAVVAIGSVAVCGLLGARSASAVLTWPQQIGDPCAATGASTAQTAIVLNNDLSGAALPISAPPETPAVVTKWRVNAPAGIGPVPEQLVVFHQVGEEEDQLIGESSMETVVSGATNEFATRIPIPEYGQIGLRGPGGALVCDESLHLDGLVADPWSIGESRHFKIEVNTGVPVTATLEPDRDRDGYGDETQDGCPLPATVHTACPFVRFRPHMKAYRRGILLEVNTDDPTHVEVSGQVAWGYRSKPGGAKRRAVVALPASTEEVGKEATVALWLGLPEQVTRRLAELTRAKELKARLAVVVTNVVGEATTHSMTARLRGWKKRAAPSSSARSGRLFLIAGIPA
jgi:hypothetical protein